MRNRENFLSKNEEQSKVSKWVKRIALGAGVVSATIFGKDLYANDKGNIGGPEDNHQTTTETTIDINGEISNSEKIDRSKEEFIELVKGLQKNGTIKFEDKPGHEPAVNGQVGKYKISCEFHHFEQDKIRGEIYGGNNERIIIEYQDNVGSTYYIESAFGKFRGFALNHNETPGFKAVKSDDPELMTYGIAIKPGSIVYLRVLTYEEINKVMLDVNETVSTINN